jgi:hypothetical protein
MAKQTINIGAAPNDGTGTPLRTSFDYCNQNFTELYTATGPSGNNIVVPGSATITGDLTVDTSTLKVDSTGNAVGIGAASPTANTLTIGASRFILCSDSQSKFGDSGIINGGAADANTQIQYFGGKALIFSEGASNTKMTLNSTGLGVGASPSTRLHISNTGDVYARIATTSVAKAGVQLSANGVVRSHLLYDDGAGTTYLSSGTGFGGSGQSLVLQSGTSLVFYTNNQLATANMTLDASGNLLVGTTSALNSVAGSYQVAIGGSGIQTLSQAISAATATTICRSGSGGMAVVAGYNGTGQYSAIIIFSYGGGGGVTVVSSQNNTGSTITYALSGVNVQVTSSLALTNLSTTCIRTA